MSCSHEFPFKKLTARCESRAKRPNHNLDRAAGEASARSVTGASRPRNPRLVEADGSTKLERGSYQFESDRVFPDLLRKPVVRQVRLQAGAAIALKGGAAVSDVATGNEASSKRVRTVTLAEQLDGKTQPPPAFLQPVLDAFLLLDGVEVHLLTESNEDGWTIPMSTLFDEDGVIEARLMLNEQGVLQPRRLSAFLLGKGNDRMTGVFIESEPLFPLAYPAELGDAEEAHATMVCASKDFLRRLVDPARAFSVGLAGSTSNAAREAILRWAVECFQ
jgi:hypothetical protein